MKTSEIAKKYNIDQREFEMYLRRNKLGYDGMFSYTLDDNIEEHVKNFLTLKDLKNAEIEAEKKAEDEKNEFLSKILITSGFNFDGYTMKKYSGYISGDDCITMPRDNFWGDNKVSDNLCNALVKIRRQAIKELKEAAYDLGCNAVIGVDFDYLTMDPQHASALNNSVTVYEPYVICVTANGNAVVIEKD